MIILNYIKLNRLQQQYLNNCACNNCELCNKQTRAITQLQKELEMARCELRSLRHYLLLSNSSKQLNCLSSYDDPIPPPIKYSCSVPNTPKQQRFENVNYYNDCQDCYAEMYHPTIHNINTIPSPCGLEHLLPNVNSCNCCLEEYANQENDLHQTNKKAYEHKKTLDNKSLFIQNPSSSDDASIANRQKTVSKNLKTSDLRTNEDLVGINKLTDKLESKKTDKQVSRLNKNKTSL